MLGYLSTVLVGDLEADTAELVYTRSMTAMITNRRHVGFTRPSCRPRRRRCGSQLAIGELIRIRSWGPITEQRFATTSGLEVEIDIGCPAWASVMPVDPGTRRVVTDGARILHDPMRMLATLLRACRS